ncbi:SMP-30/gluconolactonase/LRE family protein [Nocardia stercoris]|nr:SMP-30/gluconolactonase/LRE family protein [Nocardia stercoris]
MRNYLRACVSVAVATAGIVAGQSNANADPLLPDCSDGWQSATLTTTPVPLENLESDGAGGFYLSASDIGELRHIDADGTVRTVLSGLVHPGGIRVAGNFVYFVTGDHFTAPTGELVRYDPTTGELVTLVTGLNMPNGLLLLPDGDLLVATSRDVHGISRYRPSTGEFTAGWADVPGANGLALAPDGRSVYTTDLTFQVEQIPLDAPHEVHRVLGVPDHVVLPDDLDATASGELYLADHAVGSVDRIDPATGTACTIVTGVVKPAPIRIPPDGPTSVRIAHDPDGWVLYVTAADGTLRRMVPPPGVDLTPGVRPH